MARAKYRSVICEVLNVNSSWAEVQVRMRSLYRFTLPIEMCPPETRMAGCAFHLTSEYVDRKKEARALKKLLKPVRGIRKGV